MIIAVDFDGTIVEHCYPEIGKPMALALETLKKWQADGHQLILWTCRNDVDPAQNGRKTLTEAVDFCKANGLEFNAVNANIENLGFNCLPKIYADWYIDDRANEMEINWSMLISIFNQKHKHHDNA